ncbi:MAG: hypothetical protein EBU23_18340 [Mycobacteriaceae bacterium]|nr:hypothetical protein [Mycobacteriaceae bacterium]
MNAPRIIAGAAAALALVGTGAAMAAPAPNAVNSMSATCVVAKSGKAKAATTVKITGSNLAASFLSGTGCQSPVTIVQKIAKTGIQEPFRSGLYSCTPSISGSTGKWTCSFQAADTDGMLKLTFTYKY